MTLLRRVVVTGIGVNTCIGTQVDTFWRHLINGHSGIISTPDEFSFLPCRIAGIIDAQNSQRAFDETRTYLSNYERFCDQRHMSRASMFALCAAKDALDQAGWKPTSTSISRREAEERAGVHFGTGLEGIGEINQTSSAIRNRQYRGMGPHALTKCLANMPAGHISFLWGLRGPCMSVTTACAAGAHSIGDAYRMIQHGEADLVLAGGCEATIHPWAMAAFARIRALSTKFNDDPSLASRPFDQLRDGFTMSEGAGAMVLQVWPPTEALVEQCGVASTRPIAEIIGYGRSCDAHNLVSPDPGGNGALRSMLAALHDAGLSSVDEVGHINCHATSTPVGDIVELVAICQLLTNREHHQMRYPHLIVNSIKGHVGHLLGAAGAVEAIYSVLAVSRGKIASTCNLHNPILSVDVGQVLRGCGVPSPDVDHYLEAFTNRISLPKHDALSVDWPSSSSPSGRRVAMTNSFGFGGTNATLVFGEWNKELEDRVSHHSQL